MPTVRVQLAERSYDVIVAPGCLAEAPQALAAAGLRGRAAVISDATVAAFHSGLLLDALAAAGHAPTLHTVPAGEASKSLAQTEALCQSLAAAGHDRRSFVVALGGGVVGDLAGFVAAVFYRGIPFAQIPTTIVAQVDSSVGGKTGVNLAVGKNLVGSFHQPRLVLADPHTLRTLPDREFREGFAEVVKHAAIRDGAMLAELAALDPASRDLPPDLLARNIAIKARIVEADEHETTGVRALLNFGHTVGHGIEAAVPYGDLLHGEAIALGLRAALRLSELHVGLDPAVTRRIVALLRHFGLPVVLPELGRHRSVMEKLARDKKFAGGAVRFVLLRSPGDAFVSSDVTRADIEAAVSFLRQPPEPAYVGRRKIM